MRCAVCGTRPAEFGAYCGACLADEAATISDEDLQAAADILDRAERDEP